MNVTFDKSFSKCVAKIKDQRVKDLTIKFIEQIEQAKAIEELSAIKKMKGSRIAYRKRIGDYRIGFEYSNDTIAFIIIAHRKDIYNFFP